MGAAGKAWISIIVLVACIALLPGLLYLLRAGLGGWLAAAGRPCAQWRGGMQR